MDPFKSSQLTPTNPGVKVHKTRWAQGFLNFRNMNYIMGKGKPSTHMWGAFIFIGLPIAIASIFESGQQNNASALEETARKRISGETEFWGTYKAGEKTAEVMHHIKPQSIAPYLAFGFDSNFTPKYSSVSGANRVAQVENELFNDGYNKFSYSNTHSNARYVKSTDVSEYDDIAAVARFNTAAVASEGL